VASLGQDGAAELKHTRSGRRIAPTQRAVRAADAAARHLARGQGDRAADLLEEEAKRVHTAIERAEPRGADARALIAIHDNFQARYRAYRATTPATMIERAEALRGAGEEASELSDELNHEGYGSQAARLRALARDSAQQADRIEEAATNQSVLVAQALLHLFDDAVALLAESQPRSGLATLLFGGWSKTDSEHTNATAVLEELELVVLEDHHSFHEAWETMFADDALGMYTKDFPFTSRHAAASFLRDAELTKAIFLPMYELSRCFEVAHADAADRNASALIERLQELELWPDIEATLRSWRDDAPTPDVRSAIATALLEGSVGALVASGVASFAPRAPAAPSEPDEPATDTGDGGWTQARRVPPERSAGGSGLFRSMGADWRHFRNASGSNLVPPVARPRRGSRADPDPRRVHFELAGPTLAAMASENDGEVPDEVPTPLRALRVDQIISDVDASDGELDVVALHRVRYIDAPWGARPIRERVYAVISGNQRFEEARESGLAKVEARVLSRAAYELRGGDEAAVLERLNSQPDRSEA